MLCFFPWFAMRWVFISLAPFVRWFVRSFSNVSSLICHTTIERVLWFRYVISYLIHVSAISPNKLRLGWRKNNLRQFVYNRTRSWSAWRSYCLTIWVNCGRVHEYGNTYSQSFPLWNYLVWNFSRFVCFIWFWWTLCRKLLKKFRGSLNKLCLKFKISTQNGCKFRI